MWHLSEHEHLVTLSISNKPDNVHHKGYVYPIRKENQAHDELYINQDLNKKNLFEGSELNLNRKV